MDHAIQPAPAKRSRRSKAPANLDTVAAQYAAGQTTRELAREYGTSHVSIQRWLDKHHAEMRSVERYKLTRADILARVQSKALKLQEEIIEGLEKDSLAGTLTPQQKSGLLQSLNIVHGTLFDKERLERGQSSHNISVLSRMIDNTVDDMYKPQHIDEGIRSTPEKQEKPNDINGPNV